MKFIRSLENFCFKIIFFLVNFIILIGESVQKIFLFLKQSIFRLFSHFARGILYLIKKIRSLKISIKFPKIKLKIKLPRLPHFVSLKFKFFSLGVAITLGLVFIYQSYIFVKNLPSPTNIGKINYSLTSHIYDRNGNLLYEIYRDQNRTPIKLSDLPDYVIKATVAAEDKDFYHHKGISLVGGIFRAVKDMISHKGLQGGSTITQQLVKTALLTPERTIDRKIKEIILALWAEKLYTKNQILEMYLNQVPYGGAAYGIEEAARIYFGKSAKDLSLEESATLAGLPQAPSVYSPHSNPRAAIGRRNTVLRSMYELKMIDKKKYESAIKKKLVTNPPKTTIKAPHFVFYVRGQLEDVFGIKEIEEGGLKVVTTLDLNIQKEAEKILQEEIDKLKNLNVTNGAILVTRPSTGEILAMVGSVDYFANSNGAFNVTTALRQPGSSIKPIMYSLALEKGITAATILDDSPVVFNIAGSEPYRPVNYDNKYHGKIPLRYALANSYNIPAVRTLSMIGVDNFINHAKNMGITTWTDSTRYGLSLTLGGGEVRMVDMAVAFGVLANEGKKTDLKSWIKIEDVAGRILSEASPHSEQILDKNVAFIISDILSDSFARQWAFGPNSALEIPGYKVAVKTGTTNDMKDNWTIGYTPDFLVAVWVGNNDSSPMNPYLTSGITGAAPIWNRVMTSLLKNYTSGKTWYQKPDNIVEKNCYFGRKEYFIKGTEDKVNCQGPILNQIPTPTPEGYRDGYKTSQ